MLSLSSLLTRRRWRVLLAQGVVTVLVFAGLVGVSAASASPASSCSFVPRTGQVTLTGRWIELSATRSDGVLWWRAGPNPGPWAACSYGSQPATLAAIKQIDVRLAGQEEDDVVPILWIYLGDLSETGDALPSGLEHETINLAADFVQIDVVGTKEPTRMLADGDAIDRDGDDQTNLTYTGDDRSVVVLFTGHGDDVVNLLHGDPASTFYVLGGDDLLEGYGGYDDIEGGPGDDWLYGGDGQDVLDGEAGYDHVYGGNDSDWCISGGGTDYLLSCELIT